MLISNLQGVQQDVSTGEQIQQINNAYSFARDSSSMLRPGCGHVGHSTAILPSSSDATPP